MPKIVYDMKLRRPACPILQVVLGGDEGIARNLQNWLINPTPDMKCYEISEEQLKKLEELDGKNKMRDL